MSELLAPAGDYESFIAAVSNGCDAIYLALEKFGARAYANNFSFEELEEVISYAHLRNVKIYVTMNTIVYNYELKQAYEQIDILNKMNVDGIIIQDISLIDYVNKKYPDMEAHCSTQMGIDDIDGSLFCKQLGAKRIVLGRETTISNIKKIKEAVKLPVEIFVHGALCVSYSGNCLMSGLIGYRSGNRGRCVGSCRKPYKLINTTTNETISNSYILSMKDLNTTANVKDLLVADSLKIEGRMKEPYYVANIVNSYRQLLDGTTSCDVVNKNLEKTFNRTFTKGYIFGEDKKNITNLLRPNNNGFEIGTITSVNFNQYTVKLTNTVYQNDQIRIVSKDEEVNFKAVRLYDLEDNLINSSSDYCIFKLDEKLNVGDTVYKTKDVKFYEQLEKTYPKEFKRIELSIYLTAVVGEKLSCRIICDDTSVNVISDYTVEKSDKFLFDKEKVQNQFDRLKSTPYTISTFEVEGSTNAFIPNKIINDLRRIAIEKLDYKRLLEDREVCDYTLNKKTFEKTKSILSCYVTTKEQYDICVNEGIDCIYYNDNVYKRNECTYKEVLGNVLVGGYGGINYFKDKDNFVVSDYSLNVVNSTAVNLLHNNNVSRVTLSHEMNRTQIEDLISNYILDNDGLPNLELIVYGRQNLMQTKYCPLKAFNLCGECKKNKYVLEDDYGSFPILSDKDCDTTILNGKILYLIDEIPTLDNISSFRLQFTTEDAFETKRIIDIAKSKLYDYNLDKTFNTEINTRGHFNKEIL